MRGYPPRKANATSMGDAINWGWIVECGKQANRDVIVVSRDSDYGIVNRGKEVYLNDWLAFEFAERAPGRKVTLARELSHALKALNVTISDAEVKEEKLAIANSASSSGNVKII